MSATSAWMKSSYSSPGGDACVEIAIRPQAIHVRDSKNAAGPRLTITPHAWAAFIAFAAFGG
ncbi:DUF397 domain-containing protein [Streptomyces sp. NPDC017529]|uniref:DUF397 domain-containing protein n=1 Tax=Streptomyces sp. NPDC017529 TaxID=3365000 RepID=UPI0037A0C283